jgi:hypothetical protein
MLPLCTGENADVGAQDVDQPGDLYDRVLPSSMMRSYGGRLSRISHAGNQHHPVVSKIGQATCGNHLDTLEVALLRSLPKLYPNYGA